MDARRIAALRSQGVSWASIAAQLGVGEGTVYRLAHTYAKNPVLRHCLKELFLASRRALVRKMVRISAVLTKQLNSKAS